MMALIVPRLQLLFIDRYLLTYHDEKIPTDLLALHIRHALHYLGERTG